MRAAVLQRFREPLVIEERPDPPATGEAVLVRVRGAGVCHTDVHLAAGRWPEIKLPLVLGHEIAGEAPGLGPVLVYASWGCGECDYCRAGEEQLCPRVTEAGWVKDGGYADVVCVPTRRYLFPLRGIDPGRAPPLADAGIAERGELTWHVETLPLEQANEALDPVRRGDVAGRLVLTQ